MMINVSDILMMLDSKNLEHEYSGKDDLTIKGFSELHDSTPNTVVWIKNISETVLTIISQEHDYLIITGELPANFIAPEFNIIESKNSKAVFFEILNSFFAPKHTVSISPASVVETKNIGVNVSIGHNCYICDGVSIGNNVVIKNNVVIECPCTIGDDCIIESGAVIGVAGYGYYKLPGNLTRKVPDYGGVTIGNRVEIGANTCIARGTLSDTVIEDDVKIDNLCHIAHNAVIKNRSFVVASCIIQGSCVINEDAYIAPGAIVMNQKSVGRNSFVGMGAVVTKDVDEDIVVTGFPAKQISTPIERARGGL